MLSRKGVRVRILEARDRIGGRIWTVHDPFTRVPIELGAEFIHGRPPEIFDVLKRRSEKPEQIRGDDWYSHQGKLSKAEFFERADQLLDRMDDSGPDESFEAFLARQNDDAETKDWARKYVEGFNAARADSISVHALVQSSKAEEEIDGDRQFRLAGGYNSLLRMMRGDIDPRFTSLHTSAVVKHVRWSTDQVFVVSEGEAGRREWRASAVLITLPLGVLQAGDVIFDPPITAKHRALSLLYMGEVIRVTLTFDHPIWQDVAGREAREMRFLFSDDEHFPTLWTHLPEHVASITGWAEGRYADNVSGHGEQEITRRAATSLANVLGVNVDKVMNSLSASYLHDWQSDRFSRGSYSWPKAGGADAHHELSLPLENRLFFAGEATDFTGHFGTVHGAIASGLRAGKEILSAL